MTTDRPLEFWNSQTYQARVKSFTERTLHEAGSPNRQEIEAYRIFLKRGLPQQKESSVLVLGMTPSLRNLALEAGCRIMSIDRNLDAISFFKDWILPEYSSRETIVNCDWKEILHILNAPVNTILGDGVFGNILSLEEHRNILQKLKASLNKDGVMIFRKILVPPCLSIEDKQAEKIIDRFRMGLLTEAEFGFDMRIFGSYVEAYDLQKYTLNNKIVFDRYHNWLKEGKILQRELEIVNRYYFGGLNLIPPQEIWEKFLRDAGLKFEIKTLKGKSWYEYYPIYVCSI